MRAALHGKQHPSTPFKASTWKNFLAASNLTSKYPSIVPGIQSGFVSGIPKISVTRTPLNSPSLQTLPNQFQSIIQHEFQARRYLGPFTRDMLEATLGPFQSSPLSLVPKPHKPDSYRLVQNFSYSQVPIGEYTSINHHINSTAFPCTWGTFAAFLNLVWHLPPGSQGMVRDASEAYRQIPLHPSQWPGTVVRLGLTDEDADAIQAKSYSLTLLFSLSIAAFTCASAPAACKDSRSQHRSTSHVRLLVRESQSRLHVHALQSLSHATLASLAFARSPFSSRNSSTSSSPSARRSNTFPTSCRRQSLSITRHPRRVSLRSA